VTTKDFSVNFVVKFLAQKKRISIELYQQPLDPGQPSQVQYFWMGFEIVLKLSFY